MKVLFIRHGKTMGNIKRQYIGRTDEPLCEEGIRELRAKDYPTIGKLVVSPMQRCKQTAQILFPHQDYDIVEGLRECDFGLFEGKNYEELKENPFYQKWLKSGGEEKFPLGESPAAFKQRCCDAFRKVMEKNELEEEMGLIIHGGSIMAILEKYGKPHRPFYDYQVLNGQGFIGEYCIVKKEITNIMEIK